MGDCVDDVVLVAACLWLYEEEGSIHGCKYVCEVLQRSLCDVFCNSIGAMKKMAKLGRADVGGEAQFRVHAYVMSAMMG